MAAKTSAIEEFIETTFKKEVNHVESLPQQEANWSSFPPDMHPQLQSALKSKGINQIYQHQLATYESVAARKDTVLMAATASGKTLSFTMPILDAYLKEEASFTGLFLYPTKALSRDQESTLSDLLEQTCGKRPIGTFDGDTPRIERDLIQKSASFVITNLDMLHSGVLPNHSRRWKSFLSRLRFVVIDEVHTYRGAYGSHVANVLRRLQRVCALYGAQVQFICCSATIGNPQEHVEALCGRSFNLISSLESSRPERKIYFLNPSLVKSQGGALYRKGAGSVAIPLLRQATRLGVRTICFMRGRQEVERIRRAAVSGFARFADQIQPYRGGLLPNERRALEKKLSQGQINTIISTNALELGIDIGELELCILCGHPGSLASFWQQAGRVGRSSKKAIIVFIAQNSSINQYLVHHPNFVLGSPIEQAWLSRDNPYIFLQHLPCAAYEYPLAKNEAIFQPEVFADSLEVLLEEKTLKPYGESFRYAKDDYPSKGVNLRGMTDYNIQIICKGEVIGELDPIGARGTLYKDAIYQHLGRRYMSCELDLERKTCTVIPTEVQYFTEAVWESRVEHTFIEEQTEGLGAQFVMGGVYVNKQPKMYKKIREGSYENIGYGPITLEPFIYETIGFSLIPKPEWVEALRAVDEKLVSAALYGLAYSLKQVAPSFFMGDRQDIDTDVSLSQKKGDVWQGALFVFDTHEGGVGYCERTYHHLKEVYGMCQQVIQECECDSGCPACVPPLPPGVIDEEMEQFLVESNAAKQSALSFLQFCLTGRVAIPEVEVRQTEKLKPEQLLIEDQVRVAQRQRLRRAAGILQRKRERQH